MTNIRIGSCRCGEAEYQVDLTNAKTTICHCLDCQKHLGATYSVFTVVPADQFRWINKPAGNITFSQEANRLFCTTCGTYMKWEGLKYPEEAEFNTLTLPDPENLKIYDEIYTRTRISWVQPIDGAKQYTAGRG